MGPARQRHRRSALLPRATRQSLPSPSVRQQRAHIAHARRFRAAASRAPLAGRQGPPLLVPLPPRVGGVARPPL
jgi:hypothetical protein